MTTDPPPIFVTGVPRSGTTLLAAMLCAHSRISCGPETSFFFRLAQVRARRLVRKRSWPRPAVEFLVQLQHSGQSVLAAYGLDQAAVAAYLEAAPPAVPSILGAVTELYMRRSGKVRWAEKTTSHMLHTAELRRYFPRSPVIRIVRDPRDVALSQLNVPWGPRSFLEAILFWRDYDEAADAFFRSDRLALTVRYEDLVDQPERELRRICAFVGEEFEPAMVRPGQAAEHVNRTREPWKEKAASDVDRSRIAVWQRTLTEDQLAEAAALVGDRLQCYGYPVGGPDFRRYVSVYPFRALVHWPVLVQRLAGAGTRFWPAHMGETAAVRVYLGDPETDQWLGSRLGQRLRRTAQIAAEAVMARLGGQPVWWVRPPGGPAPRGYLARLLTLLLREQPTLESLVIS